MAQQFVAKTCPDCGGSGQNKQAKNGICSTCKGNGQVTVPVRRE